MEVAGVVVLLVVRAAGVQGKQILRVQQEHSNTRADCDTLDRLNAGLENELAALKKQIKQSAPSPVQKTPVVQQPALQPDTAKWRASAMEAEKRCQVCDGVGGG